MFSTSGDILNVVIAVCIIVLTIFISLALYYLISTVSKAHKVINSIEKGVTKTQELIELVNSKIKNSSTYLVLFGELIKKGFDLYFKKDSQNNNNLNKEKVKKKTKRTSK